MLFMVIERFRGGNPQRVGERLRQAGRMLPDGVTYVSSWMECGGDRCFQLMEGDRLEMLNAWTIQWDDLVDFEIVPVMISADFWAKAMET